MHESVLCQQRDYVFIYLNIPPKGTSENIRSYSCVLLEFLWIMRWCIAGSARRVFKSWFLLLDAHPETDSWQWFDESFTGAVEAVREHDLVNYPAIIIPPCRLQYLLFLSLCAVRYARCLGDNTPSHNNEPVILVFTFLIVYFTGDFQPGRVHVHFHVENSALAALG